MSEKPQDHPLHAVFMGAIEQAMYGKGERHGGARTPFMEQPWAHYAQMHGRGFLTGQAAKKLEEAASTRHGEAFLTEMRGALMYIGMAIMREEQLTARVTVTEEPERVPGSQRVDELASAFRDWACRG